MLKNLLSSLFCLLIIFTCSTQGQSLLEDKAVMSPFINFDEFLDPDIRIVKRHDPFDDMTLLTPKFGTQVYSGDNLYINMFSLALSSGNVDSYHPQMNLGLMFLAYDNSESDDVISLANSEVIFLIENERYVKKVGDVNVIFFNDHSLYQKLVDTDDVRARISISHNNYELDMSRETRIVIHALLSEIISQ